MFMEKYTALRRCTVFFNLMELLTAMGGRSFVPSEEELAEEAGGGRGKGDW